MTKADSKQTHAEIRVDRDYLVQAKTIKIVPTTVSQKATAMVQNPAEQALVANAIDRALCTALSNRFTVVKADQPADLEVRASIVDVKLTNKSVAAVATVSSLGASALSPVPVPRLPFGLGGLAVEAEAKSPDGVQRGAIVWARGANALTNKPRVSAVGDAYTLASRFGSDFGRMLVKAQDPYKGMAMPTGQDIKSSLGGAPKFEACEAFGRARGLTGVLGDQIGLPPGWTDKGGQENQQGGTMAL
jgi:DNA-binding transcriptional regulator YdaS (Cro superfamily)